MSQTHVTPPLASSSVSHPGGGDDHAPSSSSQYAHPASVWGHVKEITVASRTDVDGHGAESSPVGHEKLTLPPPPGGHVAFPTVGAVVAFAGIAPSASETLLLEDALEFVFFI